MNEERVTKVWNMYMSSVRYMQDQGFYEDTKRNVDYFEGRQWNNTSNLDFPQPVINITKMIVLNKHAGVLGSPVTLNYESSDNSAAAEEFTAFARYIAKELRQEDLDSIAILDGELKGIYVYHYYWDSQARGLNGQVEGGLRGEMIDKLNIHFANPLEKDEQKQEWIIISHRMPVNAVKELADKSVADINAIVADDKEVSDANDMESQEVEYCTVLTRYFRKNGTVYFEKAVKGTMLHKARSLTPLNQELSSNVTDTANLAVPDVDIKDTSKSNNLDKAGVKAYYYPIAIGSWENRTDSIYGISEVEGVLPNQRIINFLTALYVLLVQNSGAGKYIVLPGALNGQKITNKPGQTLTDYTNTGRGIARMTEPTISPSAINLADKLIEMTRSMTGATEVSTGDITKQMSGLAIAQLQAQAHKPIQEMQRRFWRVREKIGKIYEQFFRLYYDTDKKYTYEGKEGIKEGIFNANKYKNVSLSCIVSAGAGTQFAESMRIAMLDNLFSKQIIDAKTYVSLYPSSVNPDKAAILDALENNEKAREEELSRKIQELEQTIELQTKAINSRAELFKQIDNVMAENSRLKAQILQDYEQLYGGDYSDMS